MEFIKKHIKTIIIIAILIAIVYYFYNKTKDKESGYDRKCPCPGVQQPGGGMYYNVACCAKATGTQGSVVKTSTK